MKKIKNSVKTEMKNMVQKELARIMAKQISNEDFFKEMVQDVICDFYEEESEEKSNKTNLSNEKFPLDEFTRNRMEKINRLRDIQNGNNKDRISELLNFDNKSNNKENTFFEKEIDYFNQYRKPSKVELSSEQLNTLFGQKDVCHDKLTNKLIYGQPNIKNYLELRNIVEEQATSDYGQIQYSENVLHDLFSYIEKNKAELEATHEQTHVDSKSIEIYKVGNKNKKIIGEGAEEVGYFYKKLNPDYFYFELEIQTNEIKKLREISLKNVFLNGKSIDKGDISIINGENLLNLSKEIYSETIIKSTSQTESNTNDLKEKPLQRKKVNQKIKLV